MTCTIYRFYARHDREFVKTVDTLEEAQEHCADAETSSTTCTGSEEQERTRAMGPWFEGYYRDGA
jgi:hypothetical protein